VFAVDVSERSIRPVGGDGSAAPPPSQGPAETRADVVAERRGEAALVTITGEIDISNADIVEQQILESTTGGPASVRVDLTGLDYIDSAGLWILFRLGGSLTAAGIAGEVVVPVDGPVRRMVETAGVSAAIPVRTR
jgi:anti-anti-sigma factor